MTFHNELVMITGAANGIGKGLSLYYAEKGAQVIALDVDEEAGKKLSDENPAIHFLVCDVRDPSAIKKIHEDVKKRFGTITILINNAGVSRFQSLFDIDAEGFDDVIHTNLRSCFLMSKYAAELWRETGTKGRIVHIASTRAFMSEPDSEAYAASKGGIYALTHALAASLSPYQIRVNAVSPGWIHTGDAEDLRDIDHQQHLSGRAGNVRDVAKACAYLTDPDNHFVNGENIVLDGGMTRKMIYEH
ncbi:SDR family oxidoreductase [Halobacillus sp. ACCC02827]|uniref:SDR family NAD(P)-dependent oxidoreductase n=1 Tax=Bacillaceae TaxID=186817 RepID=UPI0004191793|nr:MULTISPECIES: SDR family oxidoreductase [Bacillaceae]QHT46443.1 SDR family oxidoreductase [Bacillus sp. SB49]WJE17252.1 SDR family oxidoreductase [Halobacillus sp. ACCC02827]